MRLRYSKWTEGSQTDEQRLEYLISLLSYFLLGTNGDAEEALRWLRQLDEEHEIFDENMSIEQFIQRLKEMGYIEDEVDTIVITPKGIQRIREDALKEVFSSLKKSPEGNHETPYTGQGVDRLSETKKFFFGDQPTNIDLTATLTNTLKHSTIDDFHLEEDDIEVYETEHLTNCATVLLLDISHSMVLYGEDRITPAKQVSLALAELIRTKFPKDHLNIVVFGDDAREITLAELPFVTVGPFHTNTREALRLARSILRHKGNVNKQIFLVTDGKPSAIFDEAGRLYRNSFGLDPRIVNKTLDEAVNCRRERIQISTFMVAKDPYLINFVEDLTKANKGRAYYSSLNKLGEYIFVDYIRNRRKRFRSSLP
ncbi:MAG: vWA domain-containing protein [Candidatus Kryptoniota bacterium]